MNEPIRPTASAPSAEVPTELDDIDVSLIDDALTKTPEERLRDNSRALATVEALQAALREQHGGA